MFVSKSSVRASRHDVFSHCGLSSHFVSAPDVLSQVNIGRQIDNHKSNSQDFVNFECSEPPAQGNLIDYFVKFGDHVIILGLIDRDDN